MCKMTTTTALAWTWTWLKLTAGHKSQCLRLFVCYIANDSRWRWHCKVSTYKGHDYDAASAAEQFASSLQVQLTGDAEVSSEQRSAFQLTAETVECALIDSLEITLWILRIPISKYVFGLFWFVCCSDRILLLIKFSNPLTKCAIKQIS